jgi:hypothetical protein
MASCHTRLGGIDRAHALAAECLNRKPDFTIRRWLAKEPFRDAVDAQHVVECLRTACLPE